VLRETVEIGLGHATLRRAKLAEDVSEETSLFGAGEIGFERDGEALPVEGDLLNDEQRQRLGVVLRVSFDVEGFLLESSGARLRWFRDAARVRGRVTEGPPRPPSSPVRSSRPTVRSDAARKVLRKNARTPASATTAEAR
jgi:hypothetical protein